MINLTEMSNYSQHSDIRRPDISLVILCYGAGEFVRQFCRNATNIFVKNGILDYELVLVGNYHKDSNDNTPKVVAELASENYVTTEGNPKIVCVTKIKEGMMGWDMQSGLSVARGRYIAVIDGDGQMPLGDVVAVYKKIKNEKFDLVKTYRITRGDNLWRKIISRVYNLLFKFLFPGLCSRDINSKPKIFSREAYEKMSLVSGDWFIDAEIMIQARRYNFKIGEIPTHFLGLNGRRSFVRLITITEFVKNLIVFRIKEFGYWFR